MSFDELSEQELDNQILRYGISINNDSGHYWWKRYTYCAFWNIVSTPINLTITIFTALSTGETATAGSLIGQSLMTSFNIVSLILSIVNTFFKPLEQLRINQNLKDKWSDIGIEYEQVYNLVSHTKEQKKRKLEAIQKIYDKSNHLKKTDESNYLIDLIFIFCKFLCIRKEIKWLPEASQEYKKEKMKLEKRSNQTFSETNV
jgi:hypothetical protein